MYGVIGLNSCIFDVAEMILQSTEPYSCWYLKNPISLKYYSYVARNILGWKLSFCSAVLLSSSF